MPVRFDILAVVTSNIDGNHPPPSLPFDLGDGLWLEAVPPGLLGRLKVACEQAGWRTQTLKGRTKGTMDLTHTPYAFVNHDPGEEPRWDSTQQIITAVSLSRLIWPNAVSPDYAARVEDPEGGRLRVVPHRVYHSNYVADPDARPWLTQEEAVQLAELLARNRSARVPRHGRVWLARWFAEYAAQTYYVEVRLTHVISGLEALLNTSTRQATAQFVDRLPSLGEALGQPISRNQASRIYDDRSKIAHGAPTALVTPGRKQARQQRLQWAENLLRAAVRRAIEDGTFLRSFDNDQAVDARWGTRSG
jgi:hypothetical protein